MTYTITITEERRKAYVRALIVLASSDYTAHEDQEFYLGLAEELAPDRLTPNP